MSTSAALLMVVVSIGVEPNKAVSDDLVLSRWLLDEGRHLSLSAQDTNRALYFRVALLFSEAASTLAPNSARAHRQQFELHRALDNPRDARIALERYVTSAPTDESASLELIRLRLEAMNTLEERTDYCRKELMRVDLPAAVASDLHRRLAALAYQQGQRDEAIQQAEAALKRFDLNLAASELLHSLRGREVAAAERIRLALRHVEANPGRPETIWQLARTLDAYSLHEDAWFWYRLALRRLAASSTLSPNPLRLDLAESLIDAGRPADALDLCQQAVLTNRSETRARLLMVRIGRKLGREDLAQESLQAVRKVYTHIGPDVLALQDAERAAVLAFYYAYYDPSPRLALTFAQAASTANHDASRLALGFAALVNDQHEEASRHLEPLAAHNQLAALGWARSLIKTGHTQKAVSALQTAASLRHSGEAYEEIARLLQQLEQPISEPPPVDELRAVLETFDRRTLDFVNEPQKYLNLTLSFQPQRPRLGQPWIGRFSLRNIGDFPITLGNALMVSPVVLLSATIHSEPPRSVNHYLVIPLNRTMRLAPGQEIVHAETLDVGLLRQVLVAAAPQGTRVDFTAILDPVSSPQGGYTHRLGGQTVGPVRVEPRPFTGNRADLEGLTRDLKSGDTKARRQAVRVLTQLYARTKDVRRGQRSPLSVDEASIRTLLLDAAGDRNASVRALAVHAFHSGRLTDNAVEVLSSRLSDSQWIVRLIAVEMFAARHGPTYAPVARHVARRDPHPLVRRMAETYLTEWKSSP